MDFNVEIQLERTLTVDAGLDKVLNAAPALPSVVFKSDGTTQVASLTSGQSYSIPKHFVFQPDGITAIANPEHDQNTTVSGVLVTDSIANISNSRRNDGTSYTCAPISSASNSLLLAQLTNGQRAAVIANLTKAERDTVLCRTTLKTGQTVSYATEDDGQLQLGVGSSFLTLAVNNSFGNTNRFTDSVGGQTYGAGNGSIASYVIDHLTGLAWYNVLSANVTWATAMTDAAAATHGGFSDWILPNAQQVFTLQNFGLTAAMNYAPFNFATGTLFLWTSTTNPRLTTEAVIVYPYIASANFVGNVNKSLKTTATNGRYYLCRQHYV